MSKLKSTPTVSSTVPVASSTLLNNQNLLHVKFHVNKIQENLLSKRLKQLNEQEMKLRLKNQRTSNDLINFLKDCKQSTGYLSKMQSNNKNFVSTCSLIEQKQLLSSSNHNNKKVNNFSDELLLESNTSSSLDLNFNNYNNNTAKLTKRKHVLNRPKMNKFCFKSLDFEKEEELSQSDTNEIFRMITPLKSLPESNESNDQLNDNCEQQQQQQLTETPSLFDQILSRSETNSSSTPTSTSNGIFSCTNSSNNNFSSSKASASSRSNCSTCLSSHGGLENVKIIQELPKKQQQRPTSSSTAKSTRQPIYYKSPKLSDPNSLSNIDWLASTFTFDLDLDKNKSNTKNSSFSNLNLNRFGKKHSNTNSEFRLLPSEKKKQRQKLSTKQTNEFKSRSLNILLNSSNLSSFTKPTEIESSLSSFLTNDTCKSKLSFASKIIDGKYHTRKSLMSHQQAFPIQISMSRNLIKKKQIGLINEYKNLNSTEFIKSLRQIQQNLDTKVKQFSHKTMQQTV
jgi:hypothetical protein